MFVFRGRDGLCAVRLIIFGPKNKEKNGTARRPSLPKMNEFLVGRVAEAYAGLSSVLVHNDMEMRSPRAGSQYQHHFTAPTERTPSKALANIGP
jgi:hypothetical protein